MIFRIMVAVEAGLEETVLDNSATALEAALVDFGTIPATVSGGFMKYAMSG